eukprot:scaffold10840_cov59-Cylindrotheca_fusiformis.AAC.1
MTAEALMQWAAKKYKIRKEKGIWQSESDREMLALQSEITALKEKVDSSKRKIDSKQEGEQQTGRGSKRQKKEKPEWMFEEPSEDRLREPGSWMEPNGTIGVPRKQEVNVMASIRLTNLPSAREPQKEEV